MSNIVVGSDKCPCFYKELLKTTFLLASLFFSTHP